MFLSLPVPVHAGGPKDGRYFYQVGDWKRAVEHYRAEVGEKTPSADLARAAEAFYHAGRLEDAERLAKRALEGAEDTQPRVLLALIRAERGGNGEATGELRKMLSENPDDYRVLTALGILAAPRDADAALGYFSKAVGKRPDFFPAWFHMGLIYEEREMFEDASRAYGNAVKANPLSAQAHNNLGYSYKERHFYAYAVDEYRKAIDLMPDNAGYYYNVGNAYTYQERIEDAFLAYQKALALEPAFAKAHYNMARTYLRKDMVREAIGEFRLYLKYGNRAVFAFVAPEDAVEGEIEELEHYLKYNAPRKPAAKDISR